MKLLKAIQIRIVPPWVWRTDDKSVRSVIRKDDSVVIKSGDDDMALWAGRIARGTHRGCLKPEYHAERRSLGLTVIRAPATGLRHRLVKLAVRDDRARSTGPCIAGD